jgi:CheY-like chemotaxis protein
MAGLETYDTIFLFYIESREDYDTTLRLILVIFKLWLQSIKDCHGEELAMLPNIMIVEDDPAIREVYVIKFELEGYDVRGAENGQKALELLEAFKPDIILLDMMMPVMGGLDFMRHYHKRQAQAEVIVFSNMSAPNQVKDALALGALDYWIKSDYTPQLVVQRIMQLWTQKAE